MNYATPMIRNLSIDFWQQSQQFIFFLSCKDTSAQVFTLLASSLAWQLITSNIRLFIFLNLPSPSIPPLKQKLVYKKLSAGSLHHHFHVDDQPLEFKGTKTDRRLLTNDPWCRNTRSWNEYVIWLQHLQLLSFDIPYVKILLERKAVLRDKPGRRGGAGGFMGGLITSELCGGPSVMVLT